MDDKTIMENLLQLTKGACDLYMHGAIESATPNVHQTFSGALSSSLAAQDEIYRQMSQQGWYTTEQAPAQQLQQTKQSFSPTC